MQSLLRILQEMAAVTPDFKAIAVRMTMMVLMEVTIP
jgi:hypothetical protein